MKKSGNKTSAFLRIQSPRILKSQDNKSPDVKYDKSELEINKSEFVSYGFTLRRTKDPEKVTERDLKEYMFNLCFKNKAQCMELIFEHYPSLHAHGIIQIKKKTRLINFRTRGWYIYLDEIYDQLGWMVYITKQQNKIEEDDIIPKEHDIDIEKLKGPLFKKIRTQDLSLISGEPMDAEGGESLAEFLSY